MTGEMHRAEVTPEAFPIHFAIAEALGGTVEPFDQYQGPYIVIGSDIRAGSGVYAVPIRGLGIVRLWVCTDDDAPEFCTVYNESNEKQSGAFWWSDRESAIDAAREVAL